MAQGSYDSAEISELCGLFLLNQMTKLVPQQSMGLYRDDGIIALNKPGTELDRLRKKLHELFKKYGLSIKVSANLTKTSF